MKNIKEITNKITTTIKNGYDTCAVAENVGNYTAAIDVAIKENNNINTYTITIAKRFE